MKMNDFVIERFALELTQNEMIITQWKTNDQNNIAHIQ